MANKLREDWNNLWKKDNLGKTLGSLGVGALGALSVGMQNSQIEDTSEEEALINAVENTQFGSGNYDNLLSSFDSTNMARTNYTAKELRGLTDGQILGNTLMNMAQGAASGTGIWDRVINTGVAGVSGLIGGLIGGKKAREKADKLNREAEIANNRYLANFENAASNTHNTMFNNTLLNMAAKGGRIYIKPMHQHGGIFSNGVTIIGNGGTHEQNPFEGVQIGVDNQGIPNMVEEGEVIWQDYVFSNRLKVPGEDITFANKAKYLQKESEERPNDPISNNGLEDSMMKLMIEQEGVRNKNNKPKTNLFADGSWLRYAPVVGSALGVFSDLIGTTNKPDYSNINLIQDATNRITPVGVTPIGTYLSYNPFDKNYYSNKLSEQAGATRRAIANQAINPGAAMAGLLTADYNAQTQLGGLFRQAEEYNQAQRERVVGFNRQTDAMNAEMAMKAAMANQNADELRLKSAITQAQMREQANATANAARSANLSGLFTNLGNVGIDILNREDARFAAQHMGSNLPMDYYAKTYGKKAAREEAIRRGFTEDEIAALGFACGGRLKKKRRGGLTY
jgi:hypothetical protein